MKRLPCPSRSILWFLVIGILLMMTACQSNTSHQTAQTAHLMNDNGSGFGGTGHSSSGFGGTGIIGTITEFGSIWVNGIEIEYGDLTVITSDLQEKDRLKLGQQVILETLPREDKTLTKAIHIYYPLAGKITEVMEEQLVIDEQYRIQISSKTHFDSNLMLKKGTFVSINGHQINQDTWAATRINRNVKQHRFTHIVPTKPFSNNIKRVIIEASFTQVKEWKNHFKINDIKFTPPKNNQPVILEGAWKQGKIVPTKMMGYTEFVTHHQINTPDIRPNLSNKELMQLRQEQSDMMQLQREQKGMIQDRMEQMHQLQNLKDQMELQRNMNHQMRGM
ncbi:MAG: DUF5666 domain-containing protein [Thiomicrorhabdus sp.]|nr:DUF5666 domain-containing protein [Thiomicrorhabdus sp.]